MKHPAFKYIKYVLFLGITAVLLWFVFPSREEQDEFWYALTHANFFWVLMSVLIILVSHVSRTERWRMLIAPTGTNPRFTTAFGAVMIGYLANLAFPRLGEVTKCGIINRYERIPVDKLIGTMVTERVLDLITLALVTVLILAVEFERFGDFFANEIATPIGNRIMDHQWVLFLLIGLVIVLVAFVALTYKKKTGVIGRTRAFLAGVWQGARTISRVRNMWLLVFHSLFIWACYFFAAWVCFFALGATEGLGASAALAVLVFGSFGMAAPVQGGLGAFHIMVIAALGAYDVPASGAKSYAWLVHESQMFIVIIVGALALIALPSLTRRQNARTAQAEAQDPS